MLHICAFLAVHHGGDGQRPHGPGCSGAPVLDAGRTTEAGARRAQVLCTGRARSDQEAEAGHAGQGQGQRQESQRDKQGLFKVGPTKPGCSGIKQFVAGGLHRWFRRADDRSLALYSDRTSGDGERPGVVDSPHEHAGATGVEAGANSCLPSPGSSNLPLRPLWAGGDGADTLRGCGQMENLEGGQINLLLEACHVQTTPDLVAPEIERNDQGQGSHGTSHLSQLGRREAALEAPQLEPGSATPGDRPKSPSDPHRGSADTTGSGSQGGDGGIVASLQVREEAVEGGHRGLDTVPDMCVVETGRRGHLEYTQPVDRPSIVAHLGMPVETRPSKLRQPHPTGVESDVGVAPRLKALLRLVLHNPTNLCYLHSTIYAVCWTMLQARLHYASMPSLPQVFNLLCHAYQDSSSSHSGTVQVLRLLPWSIMLRAWRDVNRQHDVAEFTMYLLPRISPMGMCGRWEARNYVADDIVILDSGSLEGPIPIHLHEGATIHLQRSIEGWSSQVRARYALCHAPQILCLQLMRFQQQGVSVRKDTRPLEGLSGVLHIPMYQGPRTLSTTLLPFQVAAVQHHYGESPVTGHYRSLLCGQNRFAEGRSWLTDDGKPAQIMMDSHELCTTAYLIWLRQVNAI